MFDTYYTDKIEYMTFFEAMIEEQRDMEDYVNECITLTDPNKKIFNEFQVFNEGKAGDKVKITKTGNANSLGTGKKAYGIGWTRRILRVYEGRAYPYQVGDNTGTTGFYKADALQKL